jgi:hypothetical protein
MSNLTKQHACIKFCFKQGEAFTETVEMLQKVFGDETISHTRTHKSYRRLKNGRTLKTIHVRDSLAPQLTTIPLSEFELSFVQFYS